jgi:cytochrome c551/c552
MRQLSIPACLVALALQTAPALAADEADAMTLLKDSRCTKCHDVAKQKAGPPFAKIAAKYQGDADAKAKLTRHVTVASEVEIDGEKEPHGIVKTRDAARIENLIGWILTR